MSPAPRRLPRVDIHPPPSARQDQLTRLCQLGDSQGLSQLLTAHPGLQLDAKCPDGSTVLHEAVTKTAQFSAVVEVLLDHGASLDVRDSLGNSPLHNAVLYHPSTQDTVDLLLLRGADPGARNLEDRTPLDLADDEDLREVLRQLERGAGRKLKVAASSREVLYSPELRRKVTLSGGLERLMPEDITIRFNSDTQPISSPSLLKKKSRLVMEEWRREEEEVEGVRKTPRKIRWRVGGAGAELGSREESTAIHPRVAQLRIAPPDEERPPAGGDQMTSRARRYRDRSGA